MQFFVVLVILIATSTAGKFEQKLEICANQTNVPRERLRLLIAFKLNETEITDKEIDWMACAEKQYNILTPDGHLGDEATLERTFKPHMDNYIPFIQALKSAPHRQNVKDYAYELYKALGSFAEKHTLLNCGRENGVDIGPARQIKTFNLTGLTIGENERKFMLCALKKMGILSESSELNDESTIKTHYKPANEEFLKELKSIPPNEDKLLYAHNIFRTIDKWKYQPRENSANLFKPAVILICVTFALIRIY